MKVSMVRYRIYTEATGAMWNRAVELATAAFDGFTVYETIGLWKGKREAGLVIELVIPDEADTYDRVMTLAADIREANKQEAVIVTLEQTRMEVL